MELSSRSIDAETGVISASGRLTAVSVAGLKNEIRNQVEAGHRNLIIDLKETVFIDSSGLSALVSGLKLTRERGGGLSLVGLNNQTLTVFKLTLLDRVFKIYDGIEDALKA